MADSSFFKKSAEEYTLETLAEVSGSVISGDNVDPSKTVVDVAPLKDAGEQHVSFFDNKKYKDDFITSKAGACFVSPKTAALAPKGMALLVSAHPYKAYAKAASFIYPEAKPEPYISDSAFLDDDVKIGEGCVIEPGAVVKAGAEIGERCWIESGAVIGLGVRLGNDCRIGNNATVSHAHIGNHVRLYSGVRVGQEGFGFAIDPAGHVKVPQLGRVIIQDHVEIGANTTIDRGAGPDTIIGQGTWIDNLVQIGHNVEIGRGCIIVSQVGISGSTKLGDFVAMGGQSGVAGHLTIGSGARIGAQSGIMKDVPAGVEIMGSPAVPIRQFMRQVAMLAKMVKK